MKKIFSKLENKNEEKVASSFVTNYTGKVFQINKHSVVVEEILAEGAKLAKTSNLFAAPIIESFTTTFFLLSIIQGGLR